MRPFFVTFNSFCLSILLMGSLSAHAGKNTQKKTVNSQNLPSTRLSTDIHFDDLTVKGRRQSPLGFTAAVESEKSTPSLIDYRNDYRDRLSRTEEGR